MPPAPNSRATAPNLVRRRRQPLRRAAGSLADAEAAEDPIEHRLTHLLAGDGPQASRRIPQIDGPEVPGEARIRRRQAALQALDGRCRKLPLPLIEGRLDPLEILQPAAPQQQRTKGLGAGAGGVLSPFPPRRSLCVDLLR